MDRETILKHSKAVRIDKKILPDFVELIERFCEIKQHPEHTPALIHIIQNTSMGLEKVYAILEFFEKEYHIIRVEKLNTIETGFGNISNNEVLYIY